MMRHDAGALSKKLIGGAVLVAMMCTAGAANARTLFYGMEKQIYVHTGGHQVKASVDGERASNQRFYGGKVGVRIMPRRQGATIGASYSAIGEKNIESGDTKIKPNLHGMFGHFGYKTTTRSRLNSGFFDLGLGSVLVSKTGAGDKGAGAAMVGVGFERKLGRFSPWSIQGSATAIYLLNDINGANGQRFIKKNINAVSAGIGYRF